MSYFKTVKPETGMVQVSLKRAKQMAEERWGQLENHLIKLAVWGDRVSWRREVYAFCKNMQNIDLKLNNRTYLSKIEYLEASTDFRKASQEKKAWFKTRVKNLGKRMSIPRLREDELARYIIHKIQIELSELFSKGLGEDTELIDEILDRYLK